MDKDDKPLTELYQPFVDFLRKEAISEDCWIGKWKPGNEGIKIDGWISLRDLKAIIAYTEEHEANSNDYA